jgi:hypothetical protein
LKFSISSVPAGQLLVRGLLRFPEYQRESVWSFPKRALLVDSMIRGLIVPPVFVAKEGNGLLVIDGKQRLEAMKGFRAGEFTVQLDGVRLEFEDFPQDLRGRFLGYPLGVVTIHEATEEELRELFLRLQLGMPLTAGEKLNVVRGEIRKLVCAVRDHPLLEASSVYKRRNLTFTLAAQIVTASVVRARTGEFCRLQLAELNRFLAENRDLGTSSEDGRRILQTMEKLWRAFGDGARKINRVVDILSFYLFAEEIGQTESEAKLGSFLLDFVESRNLARSGQQVKSAELVFQYDKACLESRESPKAIRLRHEILQRLWGKPVAVRVDQSRAPVAQVARTRSFTFYCMSGCAETRHQISATTPEAAVKLHDAQFPRHRFVRAKEIGAPEAFADVD